VILGAIVFQSLKVIDVFLSQPIDLTTSRVNILAVVAI
jgi:hypothetical protein